MFQLEVAVIKCEFDFKHLREDYDNMICSKMHNDSACSFV